LIPVNIQDIEQNEKLCQSHLEAKVMAENSINVVVKTQVQNESQNQLQNAQLVNDEFFIINEIKKAKYSVHEISQEKITNLSDKNYNYAKSNISSVNAVIAKKASNQKEKIAAIKLGKKSGYSHSPTTKAPGPEITENYMEIKAYVRRPVITFYGKNGAGGHVATSIATSNIFKPNNNK
ncbi:MAG: hypothetical protein ACTS8R_06590, partial [Arsenophonus sp. NC-QC1-MAG3]